MSQENVELVYRTTDAINRRDLDASLAPMDDEVEVIPRAGLMEGTLHGHDGVRRWWETMLDVFPDFTVEVDDVRDVGDRTIATLYVRGHGAGSNVPAEDMLWLVQRWRDGKCIWLRIFDSRDEALALEAVGLPE
jgi:ketosteroid isomerase-like protein